MKTTDRLLAKAKNALLCAIERGKVRYYKAYNSEGYVFEFNGFKATVDIFHTQRGPEWKATVHSNRFYIRSDNKWKSINLNPIKTLAWWVQYYYFKHKKTAPIKVKPHVRENCTDITQDGTNFYSTCFSPHLPQLLTLFRKRGYTLTFQSDSDVVYDRIFAEKVGRRDKSMFCIIHREDYNGRTVPYRLYCSPDWNKYSDAELSIEIPTTELQLSIFEKRLCQLESLAFNTNYTFNWEDYSPPYCDIEGLSELEKDIPFDIINLTTKKPVI